MNATETLSPYELERGKPMPSRHHSKLQGRLTHALLSRYESQFDVLPELSLSLTTGDATPDVAIYPVTLENWERDEIKESEPPITAMEILSPTQAINDLVEKARDVYLAAGVKSVWFIIPPLKSVYILYPNSPTEVFGAGLIADNATNIEIQSEELFK